MTRAARHRRADRRHLNACQPRGTQEKGDITDRSHIRADEQDVEAILAYSLNLAADFGRMEHPKSIGARHAVALEWLIVPANCIQRHIETRAIQMLEMGQRKVGFSVRREMLCEDPELDLPLPGRSLLRERGQRHYATRDHECGNYLAPLLIEGP